ncbi:hypothetical protein NQ318_008961 [Aromia moschata]|uniref:Uncharacterized protein n=1 Tax=Aromia moschata TaxID=1265417 RepID=A0AAV8ZBH3_9CUCU|nr:hypothetical protein NQ318_008961 [Aromia moschata]
MLATKIAALFVMIAVGCLADTVEVANFSPVNTNHTFSIESSNAPDAQYEWDAIDTLSEAYVLHDGNLTAVVSAFAELYKIKHSGNWNVNAGCQAAYSPQAKKTQIVIKVADDSGEMLIDLYD